MGGDEQYIQYVKYSPDPAFGPTDTPATFPPEKAFPTPVDLSNRTAIPAMRVSTGTLPKVARGPAILSRLATQQREVHSISNVAMAVVMKNRTTSFLLRVQTVTVQVSFLVVSEVVRAEVAASLVETTRHSARRMDQ